MSYCHYLYLFIVVKNKEKKELTKFCMNCIFCYYVITSKKLFKAQKLALLWSSFSSQPKGKYLLCKTNIFIRPGEIKGNNF